MSKTELIRLRIEFLDGDRCMPECQDHVDCEWDVSCSCASGDPAPQEGERATGVCMILPTLVDRRTSCHVEHGRVKYYPIWID